MELINTLIKDAAWITAIATLLTAVSTFFIAKMNNKKEIEVTENVEMSKVVVNERNRLSEDQYQLIAELRDMMTEQRKENAEQRKEISNLREQMRELQEVNIKLTIENRELRVHIDELNRKLSHLRL